VARPWDRLDPREYLRLQEALFRDVVRRFIYPFSPFYRRLFDDNGIKPRHIRGLGDLERIPFSSAKDFTSVPEDDWRPFRALLRPDEHSLKRSAHRRLLRQVAREKLMRGDDAAERLVAEEFKPVHLHLPDGDGPLAGYTMRDLSALAQAGARAMAVAGARRSDVMVSTMPLGPSLPFWHGYYAGIGSGMSSVHLGGGEVVRPAETALWMERLGATVLLAQPGYAEGLLRGAPPSTLASLRLLLLWAPTEMQGARERYLLRLRTGGASEATIATLLGIPEARVAWAECPVAPDRPEVSFGYHTYPDLELLEVVDELGRAVDEGQPGELVYTSLDWRGSALLRYRTGIVARRGITWDRCPGCRRTVPRIAGDLSRVEWRIRVVGPRGEVTVDLADVIPILWRATGVALWQLDVAKGAGPNGTDLATAWLGGALQQDAVELQKKLVAYGVRCRLLPFAEFAKRLGVGRERSEVRVRVREAAAAPRPPEIAAVPPTPPPSIPPPPPRQPPGPPPEGPSEPPAPPPEAPSDEAPVEVAGEPTGETTPPDVPEPARDEPAPLVEEPVEDLPAEEPAGEEPVAEQPSRPPRRRRRPPAGSS
jgi:phenylacetate-coenzyme A ligase PaaK-like adenylate-forming protein